MTEVKPDTLATPQAVTLPGPILDTIGLLLQVGAPLLGQVLAEGIAALKHRPELTDAQRWAIAEADAKLLTGPGPTSPQGAADVP